MRLSWVIIVLNSVLPVLEKLAPTLVDLLRQLLAGLKEVEAQPAPRAAVGFPPDPCEERLLHLVHRQSECLDAAVSAYAAYQALPELK